MKFIDHAMINVRAGNGGNGCVAFLREKFRPKGGPSGGDGGNGGNIYLKVDSNLSTLSDLTYNKHYHAKNGENGKGKNMHGKNAKDIFIQVPQGTLVKDSSTRHIIADLIKNEQTFLIAKGGNGGFGNAKFKTLFDELKSHKAQLVKKPFIVLITKTDTVLSSSISDFSKDFPVIAISSISGDGVQEAISEISKLLK